MVKSSSSDKIFNAIMKLNNFRIYKWIYRHPKISVAILGFVAIMILYIFFGFIFRYIVL
jgi:hypothetical protein